MATLPLQTPRPPSGHLAPVGTASSSPGKRISSAHDGPGLPSYFWRSLRDRKGRHRSLPTPQGPNDPSPLQRRPSTSPFFPKPFVFLFLGNRKAHDGFSVLFSGHSRLERAFSIFLNPPLPVLGFPYRRLVPYGPGTKTLQNLGLGIRPPIRKFSVTELALFVVTPPSAQIMP